MAAMDATRRQFLAGAGAAPLVTAAGTASAAESAAADAVERDLTRYIGFGSKQAGGDGDNRCGEWLASELEANGFAIERHTLSVPFFEPDRCALVCGDASAARWPHPIVRPTGAEGLHGPLVRVDSAGLSSAPLEGAIALVALPFGRWSTALSPAIRAPIEAAFAGGARAAVAITNGPTGRIIALNTDGRTPMLAPADAAPFLAAAARGDTATLHLAGRGGRRPAFNFVGRIDRGKGRWLVVSTPRSGWFTCAGERGGGIAAWLHLARWASVHARDHDLAFLCNSGHEYQYLGAEESLDAIAPDPRRTAFWLHLGANLASRDWHEAVGEAWPLPGTDSQRYLVVSPELLPAARQAFAGLAGLEAPYGSDALSAGELTNVIDAGYAPVAGVFGIHRYHHVAGDDARCVAPARVAATTAAFRRLVEGVVAR